MISTQNVRDMSQIKVLSPQVFPNGNNFLVKVFKDVVEFSKYPYIILNFSPGEGHVYIRVLTSIFPHEFPMVRYKESLCSPNEKLVLVSEDLFKCLSSKEKAKSVSNSSNSRVNNINFDNVHSSINCEPDKNTKRISKSSIVLDRQSKTTDSKHLEADDEDGNKNESTYTEDNSKKGSFPSEHEENVKKTIKIIHTNSEKKQIKNFSILKRWI